MSKTNSRSKRNQNPIPGWVWLFTGAVLGAFVMFLVHLSDAKDSSQKSAKTTGPEKPAKQNDIRFDFYDVLKKNNVEVPKTHVPQTGAGKSGGTSTGGASNVTEFLLQVASFKTGPDAERLRAELILLNLPAIVEQAQIRNGETWHRVIVGPYTSKSKLASARSTLISNKHEALVLKRAPN